MSVGSRPRRSPSNSLQALGDTQRLAAGGPRVGPDEFAAELEREERVAPGRFLYTDELRAGELEAEPLLEERVDGADAERAERDLLDPRGREGAVELDGTRQVRTQPDRCEQPDLLVPETAKCDLDDAR